jgi:nitrogen regulatory protein PII
MATKKQKRRARRTAVAAAKGKRTRRAQRERAKLSLKRQRAAAAFVGPAKGNKAEAMRTAGYEETTATHKQGEVFGDPRVKKEIRRLLDDVGLTDAHAAQRLYECTNAEVTKYAGPVSLGDHVAHDVRLEAVRTFFQLTGRLNNKVEIEIVVKDFTEQVVRVVETYVPAEQRGACLDEIIRVLSTAGLN